MDTPQPRESHTLKKSHKLHNVCYDIRGPVLDHAKRLEEEGQRILKLNIGNPAPFGFEAPEEILQDVMRNLPTAQGYCDSKGLYSARKAIMQECQRKQIPGVGIEDIYIGNGVSELIVMAMQALLNDGDEVLIPAPDYPLWTAAAHLSGGHGVHYLCDEQADWAPDMADIRAKVTSRTRAIVIINPNNPTGAVYPPEVVREVLDIAQEHNLVVFSDEIYDKILYDGVKHTATGALADDDQHCGADVEPAERALRSHGAIELLGKHQVELSDRYELNAAQRSELHERPVGDHRRPHHAQRHRPRCRIPRREEEIEAHPQPGEQCSSGGGTHREREHQEHGTERRADHRTQSAGHLLPPEQLGHVRAHGRNLR